MVSYWLFRVIGNFEDFYQERAVDAEGFDWEFGRSGDIVGDLSFGTFDELSATAYTASVPDPAADLDDTGVGADESSSEQGM